MYTYQQKNPENRFDSLKSVADQLFDEIENNSQ